jgi:hypothetical protein
MDCVIIAPDLQGTRSRDSVETQQLASAIIYAWEEGINLRPFDSAQGKRISDSGRTAVRPYIRNGLNKPRLLRFLRPLGFMRKRARYRLAPTSEESPSGLLPVWLTPA